MIDRARLRALPAALFQPVDGAGLAVFRILFGLMMSAGLVRFMANGWIERFYGGPSFFFKYWGFEWVAVPPVPWLYVLFSALAIAALCIALGVFYRAAAAVFLLGFTYTQLLDVTNYLNHYYLVCLLALLLVLAPLHRTWSLDARCMPAHARGTVPAWALWLLRLQVGAVYVYAGLAKLNTDWLLHAQPLNIWFTARMETPIIGSLLDGLWMAYAASWGVFLFEMSVVPLLLWSRSRPYIYVVIVAFHALTRVFFDIGMFPFIMVVAATVFFAPAWPRTWPRTLLRTLLRARRDPAPATALRAAGTVSRSRPCSPTPACRCSCRCATSCIRATCCGTKRACAGRGKSCCVRSTAASPTMFGHLARTRSCRCCRAGISTAGKSARCRRSQT
jgi:vitamin K-dependent gamma-carboxylase